MACGKQKAGDSVLTTAKSNPNQDEKDTESDVVLHVDGESFHVNRQHLARLSPYFRALFFGGAKESTRKHVEIKGVEPKPFKTLMEFTENRTLRLDSTNVLEILEAADFLQLDGARLLCCKFLERQLHLSNCLGMMDYAWQLGCLDLYAAAREVVLTHLPAIACEEDFMLLPKESIADILASDSLCIPREDLVLEVALQWATFDPSREEDFMELVGLVRPECLSLPYITDLLSRINSSDPRARLICRLNDNLPISWTMGRSLPRTRSRETLFVLGGPHEQDSQSLYQFHPYSGRWQNHPPLQKKCLTQYSVVAVGDSIAVTGGHFRDVLWYSVDWVSIYHSENSQWVDGPAMQKCRHSHCSATLDLKLYVFGGCVDEGPMADVESLVLGDSEWDSLSPMVRAVERAAIVTMGNRIYVACGLDENGDVYRGIQRYRPEIDQWDVASYSPFPRYDLLATELNGALYLLGGQNLRLDIGTDEWTVVQEECLDNRFFTGCATVNNFVKSHLQQFKRAKLANLCINFAHTTIIQKVKFVHLQNTSFQNTESGSTERGDGDTDLLEHGFWTIGFSGKLNKNSAHFCSPKSIYKKYPQCLHRKEQSQYLRNCKSSVRVHIQHFEAHWLRLSSVLSVSKAKDILQNM